MTDDRTLRLLMERIAAADEAAVRQLLSADPQLARRALADGATRSDAAGHFLTEINHYVYAGDTALHIAAAAHQPEVTCSLLGSGADPSARNRRGATPLHYAVDGTLGPSASDPEPQLAVVETLINAGADPNAADRSGVTPLHRAVRNRCTAAVRALLDAGADAERKTPRGSTPLMLANHQNGRSGSGQPHAKTRQAEIIALLQQHFDHEHGSSA